MNTTNYIINKSSIITNNNIISYYIFNGDKSKINYIYIFRYKEFFYIKKKTKISFNLYYIDVY